MTISEISQLLPLLVRTFRDYGDQLSYSSCFEPDKVDLAEFMEVLEEELTKEQEEREPWPGARPGLTASKREVK